MPYLIETADYTLPNSARVSYDFYSVWWQPEFGPKLTRIKDAPLAWDLDGGRPLLRNQNHGRTGGNVVYSDTHAEWQRARAVGPGQLATPRRDVLPEHRRRRLSGVDLGSYVPAREVAASGNRACHDRLLPRNIDARHRPRFAPGLAGMAEGTPARRPTPPDARWPSSR